MTCIMTFLINPILYDYVIIVIPLHFHYKYDIGVFSNPIEAYSCKSS